MGYCVQIEFRNVKFAKRHRRKVLLALQTLNEKWHKTSDWCRFSPSITHIPEIFEEINLATNETDTHIEITEFWGEKLGDHENMFVALAPFLDDCEIVYEGEDGTDWKQVIKKHKVKVVHREEL